MTSAKVFLIGSLAAFVVSIMLWVTDKSIPIDKDQLERYQFVPKSYIEGRKNFRDAVRKITEAELVTLVVDQDDDLTIDVGVIPGHEDRLLLHLSGVHGPEGHAGSGIQAAILYHMKDLSDSSWPIDFPTVILIHAVNPYGFSTGRRWNENNVDLNRNVLTVEQFKKFIDAGPPEDYINIVQNDILSNEQRALSGFFDVNIYGWWMVVKALWQHGYDSVKHAFVTGQYHFQKGIFFGGMEMQASWVLIKNFLHERKYTQFKEVILVDTHTGLGPLGKDTLLIVRGGDLIKQTGYLAPDEYGRGVNSYLGKGGVGKGYEDLVGSSADMLFWFPKRNLDIAVTQEFGTVNSLLVARGLILDYFAHFFAKDEETRREAYERVRNTFYLDQKSWKQSVVDRGVRLFGQVLKFWDLEVPIFLK